jgi:hypothetical protein
MSGPDSARADDGDANNLTDLLNETRILLPGTEVFLGFLMTMPFTERFGKLTELQRVIYLCTFFATILALVCFMLPAAYHRLTRPLHHKARFKKFANVFLVAGLVPLSIAISSVTWLITSVVVDRFAWVGASITAVTIGIIWWVIPLLRAHDRFYPPD